MPSLHIVEKFQHSSDHPILKYFYSILVLIHISSFLSNTLNIIFSLTTIVKPCQKLWIVSHLSESFDVPAGCWWHLKNTLQALVVISPIWKHYESCETKHEMTLFATMGPNGNVLFQTHLLFMTIYGSLNIR